MQFVRVPEEKEHEISEAEKEKLIKDITWYLKLCTSERSLWAIKDYLKYWINYHEKTMRKPTDEEIKERAKFLNVDFEQLKKCF